MRTVLSDPGFRTRARARALSEEYARFDALSSIDALVRESARAH